MDGPASSDDASFVEPGEVVILDSDEQAAVTLRSWLEAQGCRVFDASDAQKAAVLVERHSAHVVFAHEGMLAGDSLRRLRNALGGAPAESSAAHAALILMSDRSAPDGAKRALEQGAFDFVSKPLDRTRVTAALNNALRFARLSRHAARPLSFGHGAAFDSILGRSEPMQSMFNQLSRVLPSTVPVFLSGESGTGKELVAHSVHHGGPRKEAPFVELNCAAIPESLQESELFGHERGAFTGAVGTHKGKFEQAHGGTLFLDEIGEISLAVQARLLRVLQDGSLTRVGGTRPIQVDVRIVSATHRDIESMVREGKFRQDLYYRIVVFAVRVPPLRERSGDVPLLLNHFLRKHRKEGGEQLKAVAPEVLDLLCNYSWPGNVRELENTVRRALLLSDSQVIAPQALPAAVQGATAKATPKAQKEAFGDLGQGSPASLESIVPLEEVERQAILRAIAITGGNLTVAAERLGIGRATLYRKLAAMRAGLTKEA